jgi:hypothetical protein
MIRTSEAVTPFLAPRDVQLTLLMFGGIYLLLAAAGTAYIHVMLRRGPLPAARPVAVHNPGRPLALVDQGTP